MNEREQPRRTEVELLVGPDGEGRAPFIMSEHAQQGPLGSGGTQVSGSVFGWNFAVRGSQAIVITALLVLVALIVYGGISIGESIMKSMDQQGVARITKAIDEQTAKQAIEHEAIRAAIDLHSASAQKEHTAVKDAIESLDRTMQEQNFIILMTNEERKNVRLKMPPSLREKLIVGPARN